MTTFDHPAPDWFLLAWAGLTAAVLAAWLRFLPPLRPRSRTMLKAAGDVAVGLLIYAPLYGIAFETFQRSDLLFGLAIGAVHGLAIDLFVLRRRTSLRPRTGRIALHAFTAHLLFGGSIGYLYSV